MDIASDLVNLPTLVVSGILDGLLSLFVPDSDTLQNELARVSDAILHATGIGVVDYSTAFGHASDKLDSVSGGLVVSGLGGTVTYASYDWLVYAVRYFRPYIRGLVMIWLSLYNLNQLLGFLGIGKISFAGGSATATTEVVIKK